MKFLLDVHLSTRLGALLSEQGHEYRMVVAIADPRIDDAGILALAREHQEVILTHDTDFGTLLSFSGADRPSVIIFRVHRINTDHFFQLLMAHWDDIQQPLQEGAIVIIEPTSIRIRSLPIR